MNDQILYESTDNVIEFKLRDHGLDVIPDSCILTISDHYGTIFLKDEEIIPDSEGLCFYTCDTDITDTLAENNRAIWTVEVDGITKSYSKKFDVVYNVLINSVRDEDLIKECKAINQLKFSHNGTADSGTPTYLIDNELIGHGEDLYKGGIIEFVDGTNENNSRLITAFSNSLGKVTWDTVLSSAIDNTTVYVISKTFQNEIDAAWKEILQYVKNRGFRPSLVVGNEELELPHIYLSLAKIFLSEFKDVNDSYHALYETFKDKYENSISGLKLYSDTDEDGSIDEAEHIVINWER